MPLRPACARVVVAPGPAVWPDRARDGPSPNPQPRPFETLEGPFAFHGPGGPKEVRRESTQELTGASGEAVRAADGLLFTWPHGVARVAEELLDVPDVSAPSSRCVAYASARESRWLVRNGLVVPDAAGSRVETESEGKRKIRSQIRSPCCEMVAMLRPEGLRLAIIPTRREPPSTHMLGSSSSSLARWTRPSVPAKSCFPTFTARPWRTRRSGWPFFLSSVTVSATTWLVVRRRS